MSFLRYLKLEVIKIKSSFLKYTIIIPIFLSLIMIITDIVFRKEQILSKYKPIINDGFQSLLVENHLTLIWPIILMFSIIIISISIFYIDLKNNLLTHILSNPISRTKYYLSKLNSILICTIVSILLEGIIVIIIGHFLKLSSHIDIALVIRYMWLQLFCSLGLIGIQGFLFSLTKNVMLLTSINITCVCISILLLRCPIMTRIIPYLQIANSMPFIIYGKVIVHSMIFSFAYFLISTILGIIIFNNTDIQGE